MESVSRWPGREESEAEHQAPSVILERADPEGVGRSHRWLQRGCSDDDPDDGAPGLRGQLYPHLRPSLGSGRGRRQHLCRRLAARN